MNDCVFCMIARGEIPATIVYEADDVIAFDDASPQAPVHTLIIPRKHVASLSEPMDPCDLGILFSAVRQVAQIKGISESGYRVIVNSGPDANQTVAHLHVHLMGGRAMDHGMVHFGSD